MKHVLCLTGILLFLTATVYAQDCNMNEDARRYFVRANAAIKEAKSETEYLDAVEEFKKALEYAPDCPDIYYNIGLCYEMSANSGLLKDFSSCRKAIEYLNKYLELKPNAQNKQAVQNKIYELEYKYDKMEKYLGTYFVKEYDTSNLNVIQAQFIRFLAGCTIKIGDSNQIEVTGIFSYGKNNKIPVIAENYKDIDGVECIKFYIQDYIISIEDILMYNEISYSEKKAWQKNFRQLPSYFSYAWNDKIDKMDICAYYYLKLKDGTIILEFEPYSIWWYNKGKASYSAEDFNSSRYWAEQREKIYGRSVDAKVQLEKLPDREPQVEQPQQVEQSPEQVETAPEQTQQVEAAPEKEKKKNIMNSWGESMGGSAINSVIDLFKKKK